MQLYGLTHTRQLEMHLHSCVNYSGEIRGQIIVQAEEVQDSKFVVQMQLSASKLDKKDLFGKVSKVTLVTCHLPNSSIVIYGFSLCLLTVAVGRMLCIQTYLPYLLYIDTVYNGRLK